MREKLFYFVIKKNEHLNSWFTSFYIMLQNIIPINEQLILYLIIFFIFVKIWKMAWFVAYTKPRCEIKALGYFEIMGINAYVPIYKEVRQWTDRKKIVERPAISGYVFFEIKSLDYELINVNPFIRNIVRFDRKVVEISNVEMELLKTTVKHGTIDQKKISSGSFVKIQSGPFANKSGIVESINDKNIVLLLNKLKVKLLLSDSRLSLVDW